MNFHEKDTKNKIDNLRMKKKLNNEKKNIFNPITNYFYMKLALKAWKSYSKNIEKFINLLNHEKPQNFDISEFEDLISIT